ncbi:MAG: CvpA family protein [Bacteroidales bacterium]|nr:CvpA family protein [Bacteroidales bacterium]
MTTFDIIIVILLAVGAVRGFISGLIMQLTSLAALILGIWVAIRFSDFTAMLLMEKAGLTGQYIPLVSFAITFVVVVIAVHFTGKLIDKFFNLTPLGMVNKILGLVFGVLKYALIISVIIVFVEKANQRFNFYSEQTKNKSMLFKPLSKLAPSIFPYLHFESISERLKAK